MGDHVTSAIFLSSSYPAQEHFFALAQLKAADFSSFKDNVKYTTKVLVSFKVSFHFGIRITTFYSNMDIYPYPFVAIFIVKCINRYSGSTNTRPSLNHMNLWLHTGSLRRKRCESEMTCTCCFSRNKHAHWTFMNTYSLKWVQFPLPSAQFITSDESATVLCKNMLMFVCFQGFRLYQQISVCNNPIDLQKMETKNRPLVWVSCKNPDTILTFRFNTKGFFYEW